MFEVPTLTQEAIGEVSKDYDFVKDCVEHSTAVEEQSHAHVLSRISVEGTALEEHHDFTPLHFYKMIGNKLKALEAEIQAVADCSMDIIQGEEVSALIEKQNPCVRTLLQEYRDVFVPLEQTSKWKECKLVDFELKDEYKHAVLKIRGYPVDPTTSKAIDEQVDALLEKCLVEIPDNESPQFISLAFQVDKKDLKPGEKRTRRTVVGFHVSMLKPQAAQIPMFDKQIEEAARYK